MAETKKVLNSAKDRVWSPAYKLPPWLMRSKYYLLEFILALIGITAATFLIDQALFALVASIFGGSNEFVVGWGLLVVAMAIVWVPATLFFYKRSQFEELNRPQVASTKLRRFFLYIFMIVMALAVVSFKIAVVYSILLVLFGKAPAKESLLFVALPALIAAWLHMFVFWSFMKQVSPLRIRRFCTVFGGVAVIVVVALLIVAAVQSRSTASDAQIRNDLEAIDQEVQTYYEENYRLPRNLNELELEQSVKDRADKNDYTMQSRGSRGYELCATFAAEAGGGASRYSTDFSRHNAGKTCFSRTVQSGTYNDLLRDEESDSENYFNELFRGYDRGTNSY